MGKSEVHSHTPIPTNFVLTPAEEERESLTISVVEPLTQEKVVHVKPSPEKRKNLEFNNHDNSYKFFVRPGNNGQLVKNILEARGWTETC